MPLLLILFLLFPLNVHAKDLCASLPTYKPGIDVRGKPVVPADASESLKPLDYPVKVPLEVDVAEKYGVELPEHMEFESDVVEIELHEDGRVTYNGQDISEEKKFICGTSDELSPERPPSEPVRSSDKPEFIDGEAF